jgi:hypothetical protein
VARKIFHSFRYTRDWWRVQTIRNIGAIQGQRLLTGNEWEAVEKKGKKAIRQWIDEQLAGKSCVVVLIGNGTSGREWVQYEMQKGWNDGKSVVGIHIHGLQDQNGRQATKGTNPLSRVFVDTRTGVKRLSAVAKTYDPPYKLSKNVYSYIEEHIEEWIEEAIAIRRAN